MKMLKKLLAVVLTGAMALTLFTACGSNAVTEKDIADVMSDMAKAEAEGTNVTFTPRAKEREMAQKLAALLESHSENDSDSAELSAKIQGILGIDEGGVNEKSRYVWAANPVADGIGAAGQAHQIMRWITFSSATSSCIVIWWSKLSKQALISPSIIHFAPVNSVTISFNAVWQLLFGLKPCELSENVGS